MPAPAPPAPDPEAARLQRQWVGLLDASDRDRKDFLEEGRRVVDRYRNEAPGPAGARGSKRRKGMPILYANTEQLHAALYQKPAKPDVRRRFADRDPTGQAVAEMIERALTYFDDDGLADSAISAAVQDMLLPGQGVVRLEYEPVIDQRQQTDPLTGAPLFVTGEDGEVTEDPAMVDFLADQKIHRHHVFWEDFRSAPARRWPDVGWVAFRHVMDRDTLRAELWDAAGPDSKLNGTPEQVPLDWMPQGTERDKARGTVDDTLRKAEVWEVWDKAGERRLWVCKTATQVLREDPDPYKLDGFFPMPEPLLAYRTNDSVVPQPLFHAYAEQADELDEITRRISVLTKALKRRGVYDQSVAELKKLANAGDNEFVPVENYATLATKGGLAASMQTEDISAVAAVILRLMKQRDAQVQAVYEISGISDIMRGATDPDETLGAQQLKAQTGSLRLRRMQLMVQRFIRDLNRIEVDLLCEHFEPETLSRITNMQVTPDVAAMLQSDAMRGFAVDIETDSTVFADAAQMQQSRATLVKGITDLTTAWAPIVEKKPQLTDFFFDLMAFAVAPAHDSRSIQDSMDHVKQLLAQAAQQAAMQPPQPDPKAAAEAAAAQADAQTAQVRAQAEQAKGQAAIQVAQTSAQAEVQKANAEVQRQALQMQQDREAHAQSLQQSALQHAMTMRQADQKHQQAMQLRSLQGAAGAQAVGPRNTAPMPGAQQAPDGHFYVAMPHAGGTHYRVAANA